mmetsp:Transcript_32871/g.76779  ORF Transcript_32871/g.76779 Transcript_32871/m.76779 type:complete len:122 (+) Transcript_32871:194-559(+)
MMTPEYRNRQSANTLCKPPEGVPSPGVLAAGYLVVMEQEVPVAISPAAELSHESRECGRPVGDSLLLGDVLRRGLALEEMQELFSAQRGHEEGPMIQHGAEEGLTAAAPAAAQERRAAFVP